MVRAVRGKKVAVRGLQFIPLGGLNRTNGAGTSNIVNILSRICFLRNRPHLWGVPLPGLCYVLPIWLAPLRSFGSTCSPLGDTPLACYVRRKYRGSPKTRAGFLGLRIVLARGACQGRDSRDGKRVAFDRAKAWQNPPSEVPLGQDGSKRRARTGHNALVRILAG